MVMAVFLLHLLQLLLVVPRGSIGRPDDALPSSCEVNKDCSFLWPNSVCDTERSVCICSTGYCLNKHGYYCEKVKIGTGCGHVTDGDAFCQASVTDSICDNRYGVCKCPDGHGQVTGGHFNRCAHAMKIPGCEICIDSGGTCQDLDSDGTPDKCGCPPSYNSSDPENSLQTGCDVKEVPTGACCSPGTPNEEIRCADPQAECLYANDLSIFHYCTCKFGYVAVPRAYDPVHSDCRQKTTAALDPDCKTCVDNGGTCYTMNENRTMDGCLCPPMKSSSAPGPSNACDTNHVEVDCAKEDPLICFAPGSSPLFAYLVERLVSGQSSLYVRGHAEKTYCHFEKIGEKFCIRQSQAVAQCGSETTDGKFYTSHETWLLLQYNAKYRSVRDTCLYAYCRYDKYQKVSTSEVIVAERKIASSEGAHLKPALIMTASDKFGASAEIFGVKLGDQLKLKIRITDDRDGIYTSLRAEHCIVSDLVSLNLQETQAVPFILNSCPQDSSFLSKGTNFFPIVGAPLTIQTGYFTVPKFATNDYIYFHCAVRVCIHEQNCEPLMCDPDRKKRSIKGPISLPRTTHELFTFSLKKRSAGGMEEVFESPDLAHQTVGVKILNDESKPPYDPYSYLQHEHADPSGRRFDERIYSSHIESPVHANKNPRTYDSSVPDSPFTDTAKMLMVIGALSSSFVTLIIAALVFLVCFIVPKRRGENKGSDC